MDLQSDPASPHTVKAATLQTLLNYGIRGEAIPGDTWARLTTAQTPLTTIAQDAIHLRRQLSSTPPDHQVPTQPWLQICCRIEGVLHKTPHSQVALLTQIPIIRHFQDGVLSDPTKCEQRANYILAASQVGCEYWLMFFNAEGTRWTSVSKRWDHLSREVGLSATNAGLEQGFVAIFSVSSATSELQAVYRRIAAHNRSIRVSRAQLDRDNPFVYAVSYKHQSLETRMTEEEFCEICDAVAFLVELRSGPDGKYALWLDSALIVGEGQEWIDIGLIPYAACGVVTLTRPSDERNRIWLYLERALARAKFSSGAYDTDVLEIEPDGKVFFITDPSMRSIDFDKPGIRVIGNEIGYGKENPMRMLYRSALQFLRHQHGLSCTYESDREKLINWFLNYFSTGHGSRGIRRSFQKHAMSKNVDNFFSLTRDVGVEEAGRLIDASLRHSTSRELDNPTATGDGTCCWKGLAEITGLGSRFPESAVVRKGSYEERQGHFLLVKGSSGERGLWHVRTSEGIGAGHAMDMLDLGGHLADEIGTYILAGLRTDQKMVVMLETVIESKDVTYTTLVLEGRTRSANLTH